MSFFDDIGNWLKKTTEDASNALFGQHNPSPQPAQPQAPQQVPQPHFNAQPNMAGMHVNIPNGNNQPQAPNLAQSPFPQAGNQPQPVLQKPNVAQQVSMPNQSSIQVHPNLAAAVQSVNPIQRQQQTLQNMGATMPIPQNHGPAPDFVQPVINAAGDVIKSGISTGQKAFNTVAVPVTGLTGAAMAGADKVFNGGRNYQNIVNATGQEMNDVFNRRTITGEPGTFISQAQAQNRNNDIAGNFIKPIVATAGEVVPWVAPYGAVAKAAEPLVPAVSHTLAPVVGDVAAKFAGKASQYAAEGAMNAPIIASADALHQVGTTGHFDPGEAALAGAQGAAVTIAGHAAGDLVHSGVNATKAAIDDVKNTQIANGMSPQMAAQGGYAKVPGRFNPEQEANKYRSVDDYLAQHSSEAHTPEELLNGPVNEPINHDVLRVLRDREAANAPKLNIDRGRLQESMVKGRPTQIWINRASDTSSSAGTSSPQQLKLNKAQRLAQAEALLQPKEAYPVGQELPNGKVASRDSEISPSNLSSDVSSLRLSKPDLPYARDLSLSDSSDAHISQSEHPQQGNRISSLKQNTETNAPSYAVDSTTNEPKVQHPTIERDQKIIDILRAKKDDPEQAAYEAASMVMRETGKSLGEADKEVKRVIDQTNFKPIDRGERILHPAGGENMADLTEKQARKIVWDARNAAEGEKMNVKARHEILDQALSKAYKGETEARKLLDSIEHPEDIEKNLKEVDSSRHEAFKNAVKEARNFATFIEETQARVGAPVHHREGYLHHNVDIQKEPAEMPAEVLGKHPKARYEKKREYNDIREMYANDDKLKYEDPRALFKDYAHTATRSIAGQRLIDELNNNAPGHISQVSGSGGMQPINKSGKKFNTLRTPGLESYFISPELMKHTDKFVEPKNFGKAAKVFDFANQALKQTMLLGGGFHDLNVSKRYIAQEIGSGLLGEPKRLLDLASHLTSQTTSFWSKDAYVKQMAKFRDNGLIDRVTTGDGRLTLKQSHDLGSLNDKADVSAVEKAVDTGKKVIQIVPKVNHFIHEFLFGRKIPIMKLQTAEAELKRANIPLKGDLTPEQNAKLKDITRRVNDLYGGINEGFIAKSRGGKLLQRYAMLAPDFTGGNINTVAGMFHGNAKGLAARQNISNLLGTIVLAGVATGLVGATQGEDARNKAIAKFEKMFDPTSPEFLSPSIDLPGTDSKGRKRILHLPGSPIEEAIKLGTDPVHFFESRASALLGDTGKLYSNKNYYGDALVDPSQNPNPSFGEKALEAFKTNLPIPVQQVNSGNDPMTTILNIGGGRVSKDPTDKKVIDEQNYYKALDEVKSNLKPNDLAAYEALHKATKDRDGNWINQPNPWDSATKAALYLDNPGVLDADRKLNSLLAVQGQKVDPFWTLLTPQQQTKVLQEKTMPNGGPDAQKWKLENNNWYKPFQMAQQAFYDTLPATDPSKPQQSIQPPKPDANLNTLLDTYDMFSDPEQKSAFLSANPEIGNYFDQMAQYTNNIRTAKGYDALRTSPKADDTTKQFMDAYFAADKATRRTMRDSNPTGYMGMQNYMANLDRYSLDKNASLDQLITPGTDQNAAPTQAYEKSAFNLGQYDIAKGTDANGNTAYQWLPSTNNASGSTANVSPVTKITQGGPGFKGVMGYEGNGSSGHGTKKKKQKKQRIFIKRTRVHYHKVRTSDRIRLNPPGANSSGKIKIAKQNKVGAIKLNV